MTDLPTQAIPGAYSPLNLEARSVAWQLAAIVLGTAVLALSSYIEVPLVPVPVTMQTLAVTLIGALYGWRLGALTVVAWLVEGAVGLPVLSGGAAGAHHFVGPTAGYLFAFPIVAALTGWLAEVGWNGRRPLLAFVSMLFGNVLCLSLGAAWLAVVIGPEQALVAGVLPFLLGGLLKSGLGAALLYATRPDKARRTA